MRRTFFVIIGLALCASCRSPGSNSTPFQAQSQPGASTGSGLHGGPSALKAAVSAYSLAYLGGHGAAAFALLSSRCQKQIGRSTFYPKAKAAAKVYGPLAPTSVTVDSMTKTNATVTYGFAVTALDQQNQPWVYQAGWKNDHC